MGNTALMRQLRAIGRNWVLVVLGILGVLLLIALIARPDNAHPDPEGGSVVTREDSGDSSSGPTMSGTGRATESSGDSADNGNDSGSPDELGTVRADQLPAQARRTITLINEGGPYPYRQDNSVFRNSERHLPVRARGYYREFTVRTPGSADRGARRIVKARDGTLYYTDDHYASFRRVLR